MQGGRRDRVKDHTALLIPAPAARKNRAIPLSATEILTDSKGDASR